jgi:hypothetical protein
VPPTASPAAVAPSPAPAPSTAGSITVSAGAAQNPAAAAIATFVSQYFSAIKSHSSSSLTANWKHLDQAEAWMAKSCNNGSSLVTWSWLSPRGRSMPAPGAVPQCGYRAAALAMVGDPTAAGKIEDAVTRLGIPAARATA